MRAFLAVLAALGLVLGFGLSPVAFAATLTSASVTLSDSKPDATSVSYDFLASNVATSNIQCIQLEFDTAADGTGGMPSGMSISGAGLSASSDYVPTPANWSPTVTSNVVEFNEATTGDTPASSADRNFIVTGITNGDTANTSYYLIFNTYDNQDCSSNLVDSAVVQFIFTAGVDVSLTVDPAFSFTVSGATSGTVNGETITETGTTGTSIPFGLVQASTNGVAAQDLAVSTNAQNGYFVYARQNQAPTSGSFTIESLSFSHASPSTFPETTGDEDFGYTTEDQDVEAGAFDNGTGLNNWAGFSCTSSCTVSDNVIVAQNSSSPSGTETTRVGFQVGVSTDTEAGTYQNIIIYTATPSY